MRTIRSLLLAIFLPVLSFGPAWGQEGKAGLALPEGVRSSLSLPRLDGEFAAAPAGRVIEAALLEREGRPRVFVNGAARDWPGARAELARLAAAGRSPVVLYVDAKWPFGAVEWFFMACAHPDVRLPRVHLAVRTRAGERLVPAIRPEVAIEDPPPWKMSVALLREADGEPVHLFLDGRDLGSGDAAFRRLEDESSRFDWSPDAPCEVSIHPSVPFRDGARLIALLHEDRVRNFRFVRMQPPPAWAEPLWRVPAKDREGITLPAARTGEAPPAGERLLEIAILTGWNRYFVDGGDRTLSQLQKNLVAHSLERSDPDDPLHLSRLRVVVLADADRGWQHVQAVLTACAERGVRVPGVHLAVREGDAEKIIPVHLPIGEPPEGTAFLTVHLEGGEEKETTVTLKAEPLGAGDEGFRMLAAAFASIRKRYPDVTIHGQVNASRFVPYRDVVRAVDEFRAAGITALRFLSH